MFPPRWESQVNLLLWGNWYLPTRAEANTPPRVGSLITVGGRRKRVIVCDARNTIWMPLNNMSELSHRNQRQDQGHISEVLQSGKRERLAPPTHRHEGPTPQRGVALCMGGQISTSLEYQIQPPATPLIL